MKAGKDAGSARHGVSATFFGCLVYWSGSR